MSQSKKPKSNKVAPYPIHTAQEPNALMCAVADGKSGRNWQTYMESESRVHQTHKGASHFVRLMLSDGERELGINAEDLANATAQCDADDDFMLLYVSRLIAPPFELPENTTQWAKIELDEVIRAVGWDPRSVEERAEMRRRVWQFLKFGARAHIVGQRTYKHRDKMTGEIVDTRIDSPAWVLGEKERVVEQPSLFGDDGEPPLFVEVAATTFWARLTAMPDTAQFLPLGEVLGSIPSNRPTGAWARVIGLALANYWRREPKNTINHIKQPTRSELIERYTPKTGSARDILNSTDPRRAIDYWAGALRILAEREFITDEGEATLSLGEHRAKAKGYKWQNEWLSTTADIYPGPAMLEAIADRAKMLPMAKPRDLSKPKRKRRTP